MKKLLLSLLMTAPVWVSAQVSDPAGTWNVTRTFIDRSGWIGYLAEGDAGNAEGYAPKALDDDNTTFWTTAWSPTGDRSFLLNMGSIQSVRGIYIIQRNSSYSNIVSADISTSTDSVTWTNPIAVVFKTNAAAGIGTKQYVDFPSVVTAKYYKIFVNSNYGVSSGNTTDRTATIAETGAYSSVDSSYVVPDPTIYNRTAWKITTSSEDLADPGPKVNLIDGNTSTYWQSQWSGTPAPYPHYITIDFGKIINLNKIIYVQRNHYASKIFTGTFSVSADSSSWTTVYHSDSFPQVTTPQTVSFAAATARYLTLKIDSNYYYHVNRATYNGTTNLSYYYATALAELSVGYDATLPVTFSGIKATSVGKTIKIDWSTATETNSDKFEILKSTDAKSFVKIGEIKAAGNTSVSNSYTFTDVTPATGTNYYKIKEVDFDGAVTYSDVTSISVSGAVAKFTVAPNPVVSDLKVTFPASASSTVVAIYNLSGAVVSQTTIAAGTTTTSISVSGLPSGVYIVKYGTESIKIVKK